VLLFEMLSGSPPFFSKNKEEMYQHIMNKPVQMKKHFSSNVCDLLIDLLKTDVRLIQPHKRLSNAAEVKRYPFFDSINWDQLALKQLKPPFKPKVTHGKDLRNFDAVLTKEKPVDSSVEGDLAKPEVNYQGFTYEDPSLL
jgi:serine/threonine protein kinase